jgi:hypothetical protein
MSNVRKMTNAVLEAVDCGLLDATEVLMMALSFMGEYDVDSMCQANGITDYLFEAYAEEIDDEDAAEAE